MTNENQTNQESNSIYLPSILALLLILIAAAIVWITQERPATVQPVVVEPTRGNPSSATPAQTQQSLAEASIEDAKVGQPLFTQTCSACHGPTGAGVPNLGKNLITSEFVAGKTDEELVAFIKAGRDANDPLNTTKVAMPPKGGNPALSDQDLKHIVAYIRTLERPTTELTSTVESAEVLNVARDPSIVPPPINRSEPTTVKITLTIKEVTAELADGTTYTFWTFDNTVPGPLLRVMEGDTVELTLVNPTTSQVSHNIDLHAVNGPGGGAAVTDVAPGETKTFTFRALHPGVYVYHCAYPPPWHHIAQGMYGGILVEPKGGLPKVDQEFYVMQGEWYTLGAFGETGHQEFSPVKAMAEQPEYFTFNGHTEALTRFYPLQAKVGEKIRLYFGVGGPNVGSNFHVIGEIFDKVYSGSPETFVANEEAWYVPPGSVAAFEFELDVPGNYLLVDHALYRVSKGAAGVLVATGADNPEIYSPPAPENSSEYNSEDSTPLSH
jgi:nitrite reductase (NO-forming)